VTVSPIRLVMAFHNHQPVGNFENVIAAAYEDSYAPLLSMFERYPEIPFCLHTSGPLMEWLVRERPDYVDRLRRMVEGGQVEILGGAFYEPILSMIPPRDRVGQIRGYSEYLRDLFDVPIRGMWLAERVWEQSLTSDLVASDVEYTILDDYHFRQAGLRDESLVGYFTTENQGDVLRIFPGSEPMRYMIPFHPVSECIGYLGRIHQANPRATVVFADDGEKFGTWPNTKSHVYEQGWLAQFLDALRDQRDWIQTTTLARCQDELPPVGQIYIPDGSYREMTEWVLPADRANRYDAIRQHLDRDDSRDERASFLRAGFWRNFKVKYPETRDMYARMMEVSARLDRIVRFDRRAMGDHRVHDARQALYRAQCNCGYWHGAFGGLYLPHLRSAVYENLLRADRLLGEFEFGQGVPLSAISEDFNFDGREEIKLANEALCLYVTPQEGGALYEIDVLGVERNLAASLSRRPETYHAKIHQAGHGANGAHSIHDRIVCKEEGLDRHLQYDRYRRRSALEHLLPVDILPEPGTPWAEQAFLQGARQEFQARCVRAGHHVAVELQSMPGPDRESTATITKRIELCQGATSFVVRYRLGKLESLPAFRFAVEWNIAGLATGSPDRFFTGSAGERWGLLGDELAIDQTSWIGLVDEWIGIDVGLGSSVPASVSAYPVSTVSQSEAGFERVHQQIAVVLHWTIPADAREWGVDITYSADIARALARQPNPRPHPSERVA
jgi:alpha-amylase